VTSLVSLESLDWENVIFFSSSRHREMNMTTVLPCKGMFQMVSMICGLISSKYFYRYLNSEFNIPTKSCALITAREMKSNISIVTHHFSVILRS
jgi:hypothetical protein